MKCTDNCGYYYCDTDEYGNALGFPYCHYPYDDDYAPCSYDDDDYIEDADDEDYYYELEEM